MKKRRECWILALVLAVFVLCTPAGVMAQTFDGFALSASDFVIVLGEKTYEIDAGIALDLRSEEETNHFSAALGMLAGGNEVLKGGYSYDGTTIKAGLDGMTQSIMVPMDALDAQQETGSVLSAEESAQIEAVMQTGAALSAYLSDPAHAEAFEANAQALLGERFGGGYQGKVTLNLGEQGTVDVEQYDFSVTGEEIATLVDSLYETDPELWTRYQAFVNAIEALADEEGAITAETKGLDGADITLTGSFCYNEAGAVVLAMDVTGKGEDGAAETIPLDVIHLPRENGTWTNVYAQTGSDELEMIAETRREADGARQMQIALNVTEGGEQSGVTITLESVGKDGTTDVSAHCEIATASAEAGEQTVELVAQYVGTTEQTQSGTVYPGTLGLSVEEDGMTFGVQMNTNVRLEKKDAEAYVIDGEPVNLLEADEETLTMIGDEALNVAISGLFSLMGAPGVTEMLNDLGVY